MTKKEANILPPKSTKNEANAKTQLAALLRDSSVSDDELIENIGLYMSRLSLNRILYIHELYKKIVHTPGIIVEFGVRWGQNLALFESLRGIYEPYNYSRKIIGFDTFSGFPSVSSKDGGQAEVGKYSVADNYVEYLSKVLEIHETLSPVPQIKKFELVEGDASVTVPQYLEAHPETIISLAYFDFDLYEPTKNCLEAIKPYLTKGSVVAFDELNYDRFPGETAALQEVFGLENIRLQRSELQSSLESFFIVE